MAAEQKYNREGGGLGITGCKAANYPHEASMCEDQKMGGGGWRKPPGSAALA